MPPYLSVGEILKPRGLDGTLKVRVDADSSEIFKEIQSFYLSPDGTKEIKVIKTSCSGSFVYLLLKELITSTKQKK